MPSRDVNAATRLAEACWRRDNKTKDNFIKYVSIVKRLFISVHASFKST